jgi:hypothetical protein
MVIIRIDGEELFYPWIQQEADQHAPARLPEGQGARASAHYS